MSNRTFSRISGVKPGRSVFDLSYSKLFSCYHGQLIPVMCDEVIPGDSFKIGNEIVVRLMPLVAPMLHEINVYVHYFFVPYRLLWAEPNGWETFISGGVTGDEAPTLPRWEPTVTTKYSLWDYLGFPIGIDPDGAYPMAFPQYAYNFIYNEYYRDQNQIAKVALTQETILKRSWEKDYFTASLDAQQRGTTPALPFSGSAVWAGDITNQAIAWPAANSANPVNTFGNSVALVPYDGNVKAILEKGKATISQASLNANTLTAATFDIADLRLAIQVQKFMERNNRAGARYTEFLKSHFGVTVRDDRLDRPEYIGGSKSPIIVSEVLQTSETNTTDQGNMAGHGITVDRNVIGRYNVKEFGLIMGIMSIMPRSQYSQGIDRQWLRETKYDFYFPEFAHLSEQAILRAELYANAVLADNQTIFGYIGRYDEMRVKKNMACADMAYNQAMSYWTLAREFGSAPSLNQTFVECDGTTASQCRVFAAGESVPNYVVHIGNRIRAVRPMPIESAPGLIDHS